MPSVVLPAPYKGENYQLPTISLQNPFCSSMVNFNNDDGVLKVRQGNSLFCSVSNSGIKARNIESYNAATPRLIEMYSIPVAGYTWAFIESGTASTQHTLAFGAGDDDDVQTLYFNGYLMYFGAGTLSPASTGPQYYSGAAWGTIALTWPASFIPFGGDVYKNRAYFINYLSATYGYSAIDQVPASGGVVNQVDLGSVVASQAYLYIIRPISLTQNLTADAVQAFIFSNGEVLVYSGSYPDAANWALVSRFRISNPLRWNSFVDAKGDTFLFTQSEILSLRNLYVGGYDKEREEGIGAAISNRWRQIASALIAASPPTGLTSYLQVIKGIYDEKNDRLIISLPAYVNPTDSSVVPAKPMQLIYDFTLGAWYEYVMNGNDINYTASACYFNRDSYLLCDRTGTTRAVKLEGKTTWLDDDLDGTGTVAIEYNVLTAPLPINRFGASAIDGVEVLCKSDLYPQTNYKFRADLGRQESGNQTIPAQGTTIAKPMMNVGIQGATVTQLEISGSTVSATVGLELYGFNVWYNEGLAGSR